MIKNYFLLLCLCCCCLLTTTKAQQTISATATSRSTQSNGGGVSFVVENTNAYPVVLTGLDTWWGASNTNEFTFKLWYSQTSLAGTSNVVTTSDWTELATSSPIKRIEASGTTGEIRTIFQDELSLTIPANTQYRFYFQAQGSGAIYYAAAANSDSLRTVKGVILKTGNARISGSYIGYTGTNGALSSAQRHFVGNLRFIEPGCPAELKGGATTVNPARPLCNGDSAFLKVAGYSAGTDITYQWQSSPTLNGSYQNVGSTITNAPNLTIKPMVSAYYRCIVTCGGSSVFSDTIEVKVNAGALASGIYSINSALTTGGNNFKSFNDAVNALRCGIIGPVVFNVAANSGPYYEQVTIPEISGVSATNTITFNGNGDSLKYVGSGLGSYVIKFDGVDYVKVENLNISSIGNPDAWTVIFANNASYNTIINSSIVGDSISKTGNSFGIVFNNSGNCYYCEGESGSHNLLESNRIVGHNVGVSIAGTKELPAIGNRFINNTFTDFYLWGIVWANNNEQTLVSNNKMTRPSRTTPDCVDLGNCINTVYGLYAESTSSTKNIKIEKNSFFGFSNGNKEDGNLSIIPINIATIDSSWRHTIVNNIIYGNASGTGMTGIGLRATTVADVFHNTILMDDTTSMSTASVTNYGINISGGTGAFEKTSIKNNIVVITRGGNAEKIAFNYRLANVESDYNVVYVKSTQGYGEQYIGSFNAVKYKTLDEWQSVGFDSNSVNLYPQFIDPANGNLLPNIAAIDNIGDDLMVSTDILGVSRTTQPDPGAFEFTPAVDLLDAAIKWKYPDVPWVSGNNKITVTVVNTQSVTISSLRLSYTDGNVVKTQDFQGLNLISGESQDFSFTDLYFLNGSATIKAYISLVNSGADSFSRNDTTEERSVCAAFASGTYSINANQATGGNNFQSFGDAVRALLCGITGPVVFNVIAGSGPYAEQVTIPFIDGTSETNTITFNGNGDTLRPIAISSGLRYVLQLDASQFIAIKNLVVSTGGNSFGYGIHLFNGASNNIIENCVVITDSVATSTNFFGILLGGSSSSHNTSTNAGNSNRLIGNIVKGGYSGIHYNGELSKGGNVFSNNRIENFYYSGITLNNSYSVNVISNKISRESRASSHSGVRGIDISGYNNLIEKNVIYDLNKAVNSTNTYGIYITNLATTPVIGLNTIANNLLYRFNGTASRYGIFVGTAPNTRLYNNTISFDNLNASGTSYGIYQNGDASNIEVYNNLISLKRPGAGYGLYFNTLTSDIISDYNNIIGDGSTAKFVGFYNGSGYVLDDWKNVKPGFFDIHSVALEPLFTDSVYGNYRPTNIDLDNRGIAKGVTDDIENIGRALPPDIGAYEFGTALPITLASFKASASGNNVVTKWVIVSEENGSHFEVERSLDANNFHYIGRVDAKGETNYNFIDYDGLSLGNTLYYRLKMLDKDGRFSYSHISVVSKAQIQNAQISVYPNPASYGNTWIKLKANSQNRVFVRVIDMHGRTVATQTDLINQGVNTILLRSVDGLSNGIYNLLINVGNEHFNVKLIKKY